MRVLAAVVLLCACGRLGFDPRSSDAGSDGIVPTMSRCHFRDVSAGRDHTCAVDGIGDVFCWGRSDRGQVVIGQGYVTTPTKVTLPRPALQIATGRDFACARLDDNSVYCWGDNQLGQIGDGSTMGRKPPTLVSLGDTALDIGAGTFHACAIRASDRAVMCWGHNQNFAAGNAVADAIVRTPQLLPNTAAAVELGMGHRHNCIAMVNGDARCWGRSEYGQLATAGFSSRASADLAQGVGASTIVAAGGRHSCAIDTGGSLRCWGRNESSELGRGASSDGATPSPGTPIATGVADVAIGTSGTCALLTDGRVQCWGNVTPGDGTYALHLGPSTTALGDAEQISLSFNHACAITKAGELRCWGDNYSGQLGRGTRGVSSSPVATNLPVGVGFASAGGSHACAASSATAYCWGENSTGALGNGTRNGARAPQPVTSTILAFAGITAGRFHTCAWGLGVVECWGDNERGAIGPNAAGTRYQLTPELVPGFGSVSQVAAGDRHNCAVANGAVNCWGANYAGQLGNNSTTDSDALVVAAGTTSATQVCSGSDFSCAVIGTTLKCWGDNSDGQLGDNSVMNRSTPITVSLANVAEVACGAGHTCARDTAGAVFCWGRNLAGENGQGDYTAGRRVPTQVTLPATATAIYAGGAATCAKLSTNDVYCWGDGERGQLGTGALHAPATPTLATGLASATSIDLGRFGGCVRKGTALECFGETHMLGNGDAMDAVPTSPAFMCTE